MEKPKLIFMKHADKSLNKIIIPRFLCEKWGYDFYMEIYDDKSSLKPIKKGE